MTSTPLSHQTSTPFDSPSASPRLRSGTTLGDHAQGPSLSHQTPPGERSRTPRCPRCGGLLRIETCTAIGDGADYAVEDEATCMNCSRRWSRLKVAAAYRNIPLQTVREQAIDKRSYMNRTCIVDGCDCAIRFDNVSGLCRAHGNTYKYKNR